MQAIENSGTAVGVRCKDGVILGVEKLLASKMLVPGSGRRVQTIDEHVGAVSSRTRTIGAAAPPVFLTR